MYWLDIVIIVVVTISAFIGLLKGLIKIVMTLVGLVVGIILAGRFYGPLSERLTLIPNETLAKIAAFMIILVGVMVVAIVLAHVLKTFASAVMLGWVNRIGGALFGIAVALLLCGACLAIWAKVAGTEGALNQSFFARLLLDYFPLVLALLPDEFDAITSIFNPG